ncbi:tyrosine-type recombinase/integrase [Leifsonia sp. McL0607]|uniref:tyrosine-type recombinase/integrase n=1 Tax=Leifsonia sp. McL0607 TaxID=3415672 RepID=UPI003CFB07DA
MASVVGGVGTRAVRRPAGSCCRSGYRDSRAYGWASSKLRECGDLRHTYASLMFAAGFKPYEVSRWMGHANVSTTDGIYAHLYPSDYNEQIARFDAFVAEA